MTKKLFDEHENIYQITVINIRLNEMTFAPVRSTKKYEAEMHQILEDGKKLGLEFGKKEE